MKKIILRALIVLTLVCAFSWTVFADQPWLFAISSEWESTGFNNARRIVRDSNGYFHAFWHSQADPNQAPCGANCDIFYAYTTSPAAQSPSMAWVGAWSNPINLTAALHNRDNRYPAAAIEYEIYAGAWHNFNQIHVVWQAILPNTNTYEVLYANIPVTNPPTPPAAWLTARNLSNTITESLVPAIAINAYNNRINQNLHVVWQEEDIFGQNPGTDAAYSDIAYIRSTDSGLNWSGPAGGWGGYRWDNLTQSAANSQMPSIATIPEQYTGSPGGRPGDLGYNSDDVHVSYNENTGGININVFYRRSPNNGLSWNPRVNVSSVSGGTDFDAYSCIAVDMFDNPYIVFMRHKMSQREPLQQITTNAYKPGVNPSLWRSFPGPDIGMYGAGNNRLIHTYNNGGAWITKYWDSEFKDREFPTVALDRRQHVNVNWQEYTFDGTVGDYQIMRDTMINVSPPGFPLIPQLYLDWSGPVAVNEWGGCDELFPSLAVKKAAMYTWPTEQTGPGYDELWTMINGHGPAPAIAPNPKIIFQDGNEKYDWGF